MRPALLTCAYRRSEIFRLFLQSVPDDVYIACAGDEENEEIFYAEKKKGEYSVFPNQPLGKKWNHGLSLLKDVAFDYLIISGSDDVFCSGLWEWYRTLDVHYAGLLDFYFMDWKTHRVKYCPGFVANRLGEPHGAGRAIHRTVLDALTWKLWDDELKVGLDGSMTGNFRKLSGLTTKFIRVEQHGFVALDIKTVENLHNMDEYKGHFVKPEPILERLGWKL